MVEYLSPATSDSSFGDSILPRLLSARPFRFQSGGTEESDHFGIECRISIEDGISIRTRFGKGLAQLLDDPFRCRVAGHVEVQNPATPMLDHEKAVKQLECSCWHDEEIESSDHLAMIL
jgi:hypothetical protein